MKTTYFSQFYLQQFNITGTRHGIICHACSEGTARRKFHSLFNGESIIFVRNNTTSKILQNYR